MRPTMLPTMTSYDVTISKDDQDSVWYVHGILEVHDTTRQITYQLGGTRIYSCASLDEAFQMVSDIIEDARQMEQLRRQ